jgi:Tol biopolymer transport system component
MNLRPFSYVLIGASVCLVAGAALAAPKVASPLSTSEFVTNVGGGASYSSFVTSDGRYVVFSSTSDNLVPGPGGLAMEEAVPAHMNVFVRDRHLKTTTMVSVNLTGTAGGNGDSFPDGISSNGQFVAFDSIATDLISGNTNTSKNIYVRDIVSNTTTLVSVGTNGTAGTGDSSDAVITADGRYVAFASVAANLVASDTNKIKDIFVRDLALGITTLASPGAQAVNGSVTTPMTPGSTSECPLISADGRYVAFYSTAIGLVQGVTSAGEIYVRDLVQNTTSWVSTNAHAMNPTGYSANYAMSTNGQWIAYENVGGTKGGVVFRYNVLAETSDDISTNGAVTELFENNGSRDIDVSSDGRFVAFTSTNAFQGVSVQLWDAQSNTTTIISGQSTASCDFPHVDQTGRYVAFYSNDPLLTTNSDGQGHIYLRDTSTGYLQLVDVWTNGVTPISSNAFPFYFCAGGGVVSFDCPDGALSINPYKNDAFARDLVANTTEIISTPAPSMPTITPLHQSDLTSASINSNGQYVAFTSDCDGIVSSDTNGYRDVYVHDLSSGSNLLVSVTLDGGASGSSYSYSPAISGDGRYVAFTSSATNLIANDTNNSTDVFMRDLQSGSTVLVSQDWSGGGEGNSNSLAPQISADGQRVLFFSFAQNLTTNTGGNNENIYWRDLQSGTTYAITTASTTTPVGAMSADGSNVVFASGQQFDLWNAQTHSTAVLVGSVSQAILEAAISADGTKATFETSTSCYAVDIVKGTNFLLGSVAPTGKTHSQLSANGQFVAYIARKTAGTNQINLYNFQKASVIVVSRAYNSTNGGNGASDSPAISADGRYIAYRSVATNLVPYDTNGVAHIFLYDSITGGTTLISASQLGPRAANGESLAPFFSADGQTLFFASYASDLIPDDYNETSDVFAVSLATNGTENSPSNFSGIFVGTTNGQFSTTVPLTLTWPAVAGSGYEVQYKNNLTDSQWQTLANPPTIVGSQGSIVDSAPNPPQRFYRITSF